MGKVNKEELKSKVHCIIDKLIDTADKSGDLNFFEINIKHINRDLNVELVNKYKEKI